AFKLPDLQSCIDSALANSPLLKTSDQQVAQLLEDIKIQKRSWGEYVLVDANTRYGLFNQLSVADPGGTGTGSGLDLYAAEERFNYYAGVTLRLPLSYFWSNNNKVKKLKYSINEAELKREELKKEIIRMVVTEYYKLKSTYEVLGVHQDNVQTAQLDLMKAKNDIRNNTIEIGEYSTINYSYTRSYVEYIDARNNFFTQYYLLKLLTGSDF
ncbi:MAG: TolC family protein, partial [Bacteroidales bacterium]|nr:TolC family protein [Bacteroidales bacterium]